MYTTARIAAIRAEAAARGDVPSWGWHALPVAMVAGALAILFLLPLPHDMAIATAQALGPVTSLVSPEIDPSAAPGEGKGAIAVAGLPQAD